MIAGRASPAAASFTPLPSGHLVVCRNWSVARRPALRRSAPRRTAARRSAARRAASRATSTCPAGLGGAKPPSSGSPGLVKPGASQPTGRVGHGQWRVACILPPLRTISSEFVQTRRDFTNPLRLNRFGSAPAWPVG